MLELLDDSPVTPGETRLAYDGYDASRQIIMDAETALEGWTLESAVVKPSLSFHQTVEDVYEDDIEDEDEAAAEQEWAGEHEGGEEEAEVPRV